jgi:hypothetical protein
MKIRDRFAKLRGVRAGDLIPYPQNRASPKKVDTEWALRPKLLLVRYGF